MLEELSDKILSGDLSMLDQVDDTGYNRLDYSDTIAEQTKRDGGIAVQFMQWFVNEFDAVITGSLSYRKQGTVYRAAQDSLHDIDIQVPFSSHQLTPFSWWNQELILTYKPLFDELWKVPKDQRNEAWHQKISDLNKEVTEKKLNTTSRVEFFEKIKKQYPGMIFTAFYQSGVKGEFTVSAVWSTDRELAERFNNMRRKIY